MLTKAVISGYCALLAGLYAVNILAVEPIDSQTAPPAMQWQWLYNDKGEIVELREPDGKVINIRYARDTDGRLQWMTKTLADGSSVTVTYDRFERPIRMQDQLGTVHYAYDGYHRLTAVRREGSPAISYAYDTLDRIHSIGVGDRFTLSYRYDFLGRLATMETPAGTVSYEYQNGQGQIIRTLPNGIRTAWEYRPDGNLASITHVASDHRILAQFAYDYRPDGLVHQINERSPQGQRVFTYDYDTMQRLTAVTDSQRGTIEYRYDTLGNRLAVLAPGTGPVTSHYDWGGRLLSYKGQPCTHDTAGNLASCTGRSGKATFDYNGAHLLKTVTTEQGAVHYQYDGENKLIARTVGKDKTVFVADPLAASWRPWLAIPPDGKQTLFIWEGETPLAVVTGGEVHFFLHDHLGSVRYLTDRRGRIVRTLDYSPFGEPQEAFVTDALHPGFAGLFFDRHAGLYLTHARAYDASLARFLQRDLLLYRAAPRPRDHAAYVYCHGDPVNFVDRDGRAEHAVTKQPFLNYINGVETHFQNALVLGVGSGTYSEEDIAKLADGRFAVVVVWGSKLGAAIDLFRATIWDTAGGARQGFRVMPYSIGEPPVQHSAGNFITFESAASAIRLDPAGYGLEQSDIFLPGIVSNLTSADLATPLKIGIPGIAFTGHNPAEALGDALRFALGLGQLGTRTLAAPFTRKGPFASHSVKPMLNKLEMEGLIPSKDTFDTVRIVFAGDDRPISHSVVMQRRDGKWVPQDTQEQGESLPPIIDRHTLSPWVHQVSAESPEAAQSTMVSQSLRSLPTKGKQKIIAYGTTEQDATVIAGLIQEFMKTRPGVDYEIVVKWGNASVRELAAMRIAEHADRVLVLRRSDAKELGKRKAEERKKERKDPGGPDDFDDFWEREAKERKDDDGPDDFWDSFTGGGGPPGCRGPDCWGGLGGPGGGDGPGGGSGGGPGGPHRFSPLSPSNVGGIYLRGAGTALDGLGSLEGVAIDDPTGKLVLLSQRQGPINLPALRLDDIVTIFRSVYEHGEAPWVSIDPDPRDPQGPLMHVRHGPGTENTYVGWVLFEADRIMKSYSLGSDNVSRQPLKSTVQDYRNLLDLGFANFHGDHPQPIWERFWIVPAAVNRQQTTDKRLTLIDVPLKVNTQRMELRNGQLLPAANPQPSRQAQTFARWFSDHYEDIAREALVQPPEEVDRADPIAPYAELRRMALIAAIAEALRDQGVPMPAWMYEYPVKPVPVAATTPSLLVTGSQTTTRQAVEGGSIRTITETRGQRIYGGVRLSPEARAVHTTAAAPQAEALAPAVAKLAATTPWFVPQSLTVQGTSHQAVTLPGTNARDLGAQHLTATDLVVPVQAGRQLALTRTFHSLFQPVDVFGGAWTLDLPRLIEQRLPVKRSGDTTEYRIVYRLTSPLHTWQASFSKVGRVAELHDAELLIPDAPGELLALGQATIEQIGSPTQVLLFRDGRRWYFEETGQLAGWTEAPLTVVYRRDDGQRIRRIEGWYGKDLRADILLSYDHQGRLMAATGSNGEAVTYRYDPAGAWLHVQGPRGRVRYQMTNGLVTAIEQEGKAVAQFTYNERGQVLQTQHADGATVDYLMHADAQGITATLKQAGKPVETIHYNSTYQPVYRVLADGTRIDWQGRAGGALETALTLPAGERYVIVRSADRKKSTWQSPEGGSYAAEFDAAGRLIALRQGNRPLVQRSWQPDGQPGTALYETFAVHPQYRTDGLLNQILVTPPEMGPRFDRWLQIDYDELARSVALKDYSGAEIQVDYDHNGRLAGFLSHQRGQRHGVKITRNPKGQVSTVEASWGQRQAHRYDPTTGGLRRVDLSEGKQTASIELERGRPRQIRQFDGGEWMISYDDAGQPAGQIKIIRTPHGMDINYAYDAESRLAGVSIGDIYKIEYGYDQQGRLTRMTQAPAQR